MTNNTKLKVQPEDIEDYLGVRRFSSTMRDKKDMVGQANGLAWTSVGGDASRRVCINVW